MSKIKFGDKVTVAPGRSNVDGIPAGTVGTVTRVDDLYMPYPYRVDWDYAGPLGDLNGEYINFVHNNSEIVLVSGEPPAEVEGTDDVPDIDDLLKPLTVEQQQVRQIRGLIFNPLFDDKVVLAGIKAVLSS